MGKTRDLFEKIKGNKETFHAKMGIIKDRNCIDLRVAEDVKKKMLRRSGKNTQKKYGKKTFMTSIITVV